MVEQRRCAACCWEKTDKAGQRDGGRAINLEYRHISVFCHNHLLSARAAASERPTDTRVSPERTHVGIL